jgi:site-specific DNA-methyltransferase (adenine-specific)/adenine-specific DNA-methyltransferase
VFIDWNYDGEVFRPSVADLATGDDLVKGSYSIPKGADAIRIKIVDLLFDAFKVDTQG